MLPEVVWNMPRLGTFNLHASLLPQYRGAAPINWAVINGDTETGITTFALVLETVDAILAGTVKPVPQEKLIQSEAELRPAPKIFKETCRIDWNKGVKQIYDFIRGLSPYPAAWTELYMGGAGKQMMKIYEAEKIFCQHDMQIGEIRTDLKTDFRIAVKDGFINILSLQLAGKKRMHVADFLRGYRTANDNRVE